MARALHAGVIIAMFVAMACGGPTTPTPSSDSSSSTGATTGSAPAPAGATLTMSGDFPAVGQQSQFTVTVHFADGGSKDVTASATWHTSDPNVAVVSTTGLVTVVHLGHVDITASYQGLQADLSIFLAT
jgi:uncharacterized protein YjdB